MVKNFFYWMVLKDLNYKMIWSTVDCLADFRVILGHLSEKLHFLSQKIFTFWHITVFAPAFYNFKLFSLKTSYYKTFVAQKFEVLLYTLELTRIFPNRVTEPKNRQIFTFFQFSARDQPFFIFSS